MTSNEKIRVKIDEIFAMHHNDGDNKIKKSQVDEALVSDVWEITGIKLKPTYNDAKAFYDECRNKKNIITK